MSGDRLTKLHFQNKPGLSAGVDGASLALRKGSGVKNRQPRSGNKSDVLM